MLVSLGEPRGHLITTSVHRDYRLEVEYRFAGKAGNCGVLVHASTPRALDKMFPQSIEVQMASGNAGDFWCIMENIEVPDMEKRRPRKDASQKFGGGPGEARRILNLTDNSEKPVGEWNRMVIEAARKDDQSLGQWRSGQRRLQRHRRPRRHRAPGRGLARSSSEGSRSARSGSAAGARPPRTAPSRRVDAGPGSRARGPVGQGRLVVACGRLRSASAPA